MPRILNKIKREHFIIKDFHQKLQKLQIHAEKE